MNYLLKTILTVVALIIIFASFGYAQPPVITSELRDAMSKVSDKELIRVLAFFKDTKVFDATEEAAMNRMTLSQRQTYFARALKQFADVQQANVLGVIKEAAKNGKAKFITSLWAAYGLNCWATKDIIEVIGNMPEVREVKWDKDIPPEELLDGELSKTESKSTNAALTSTPEWGVAKIKAPEVWNLGFTGQNTLVAVLDDGCNYNHSDLADHLWDGRNVINGQVMYFDADNDHIQDSGEELIHHGWDITGNGSTQDNDPIDGGWHGTLVAGIAVGDGTVGRQTGVAPDAKLMIIRCTSGEGAMMAGFQWFYKMRVQYADSFKLPDVITMSATIKFSTYQNGPAYEAWRNLCFNNVVGLGIAHTNSIGNQGTQTTGGCNGSTAYGYPIPYNIAAPGNVPPAWLHPNQPAPLPTSALDNHVNSVIACGATHSNNEIWSYSGKGPATWEDIQTTYPCQQAIGSAYWDYKYNTVPVNERNALIKPDVCAPSGPIDESQTDVLYSTSVYGGYEQFGGTSGATPHVAGTIALMRSANPNLTPAQISKILQEAAVDLGTLGKDNTYGAGRIDAYQAVLLALAYSNKSDYYAATSYNNSHILEKDGSGYLQSVFVSGGEVFYRRSTNGGSTWDIVTRISDGSGLNAAPCISTAFDGTLHMVWQRSNGGNYDLCYALSTNLGGSWSTSMLLYPTPVAGSYTGQGLNPVILGMNGSQRKLLCVWAQSDGLHYKTSNSTTSWNGETGLVPGTQYNGWVQHPSLASFGSSLTATTVIYDDTSNLSKIKTPESGTLLLEDNKNVPQTGATYVIQGYEHFFTNSSTDQ